MYTKTKPLIVANWKMNLSFNKTNEYCLTYADQFKQLATRYAITLVLCPSPESLATVATIFKGSPVKIGSQQSSQYINGAFTGELSPLSLAEIGCSYCIVGHSERRKIFHETDATIACIAQTLLHHSITPIVCIGENNATQPMETTYNYLKEQLDPLFVQLSTITKPIIIAYEPTWAIGNDRIASPDHIEKVLDWIHSYCSDQRPTSSSTLLYGGSITHQNAQFLKDINYLDGLLIGSASLDFQNFEKIVSLISE